MDGRSDGWMVGRMDGWTDGRMVGQTDRHSGLKSRVHATKNVTDSLFSQLGKDRFCET